MKKISSDVIKRNQTQKNVPVTSVSVDSEIQRMRDMLCSGEDVVIDADGTMSDSVSDFMNDSASNTPKPKTVPKGIVSVPDHEGTSVQDLLNEMRGDAATQENNESPATGESFKPEKTSVVPKGIVSTDPEIERMRNILDSEDGGIIFPDGTIHSATDYPSSNTADGKPKTVPKAIVSLPNTDGTSVQDLLNEMREDTSSENSTDTPDAIMEDKPEKTNIVPKAIVSSPQWYISNPELLNAEKAAMYDFQGNRASFSILRDGRACWRVHCQPVIARRPKSACRAYDIALIYDEDHPNVRYGSSVKAYLLKPTIQDLQEIVNRTPGVYPKNIPHLLRDQNNELYLCSADKSDVSASLDSKKGVTSAATSLRFALRWINIFELGLLDPITWGKFQQHGQI